MNPLRTVAAMLLAIVLVLPILHSAAQSLPTDQPEPASSEPSWIEPDPGLIAWEDVPGVQQDAMIDWFRANLEALGFTGTRDDFGDLFALTYDGLAAGLGQVTGPDSSESIASTDQAIQAIAATVQAVSDYLESGPITSPANWGSSSWSCPTGDVAPSPTEEKACEIVGRVLEPFFTHSTSVTGIIESCLMELDPQECRRQVPGGGGVGGGGGGSSSPSPSPTPTPPPRPPSQSPQPRVESDLDQDRIGDEYANEWRQRIGSLLAAAADLDQDGLDNVGEFRWNLVPQCVPSFDNCKDHEQRSDGAGGDHWNDGPEVRYWNNANNDAPLQPIHDAPLPGDDSATSFLATTDPDRSLDTDGDGFVNVDDPHSDRDELLDGDETQLYSTYPEFPDSDCAINVTACTPSSETTGYFDLERQGSPGRGDQLNDSAELAAWAIYGPGAWLVDHDGDSIANNLLDPDSDGDGLLDGEEVLIHQTNPGDPDTDNDGLWDGKELQAGTDPIDPDSEPDGGDGMPDGWEIAYGLNPRADDADVDQDLDGYGSSNAAAATEPWTNLMEYQYHRPAAWSLAASGPWWGGTDPLNPDTDGDGVMDGFEAHAGTDATNGQSRDPRYAGAGPSPYGAAAGLNPFNEDLPRDQMDPTNLAYLEQGRTDAGEQANETVAVVDELISAAIAGNVTEALAVLYNATPIGPPVHEAAQLVQMAQDAILNLVKCAPGIEPVAQATAPSAAEIETAAIQMAGQATATPTATPDPNPLLGHVSQLIAQLPAEMQEELPPLPTPAELQQDPAAVLEQEAAWGDETAGCVLETILPFLDALLNRTVEALPIVGDLVATTVDHELGQLVGAADAILPIEVQATQEALLERPLGTLTETAIGLPAYAADPQTLQAAVTQASATANMVVNTIAKPTSRHPEFLHDLATTNGLTAGWTQVAAANRAVYLNSGGRVDAISAVDSVTFNLYTNRGGEERITAVVLGVRTGIQLDASTATRDASGFDLYVTASAGATAIGLPTVAPSGMSLAPTMTIEKAVPSATFDVEALGYFNLPGSACIAVLGFDTQVPGGTGMPSKLEATLRSYSASIFEDRTMSVTFAHGNPTPIPLQAVAAGFRIDDSRANKPVVPGYETILHAYSPQMPNQLAIDHSSLMERSSAGAQASIGIDASAPSTIDVWYSEVMGVWSSQFAVHGTVAKGASLLQATFGPGDALSWTWLASAVTPQIDIGFVRERSGPIIRAFQINAAGLPIAVQVTADPSSHRYVLNAGSGAPSLAFLMGHDTKQCRLDSTGEHRFLFEATATTSCMAGRIDRVRSMTVESAENMAHATMTATDAASASIRILDGNPLWAFVDGVSQWDSRLALVDNTTQAWTWSSNGVAGAVHFQALVNHGTWTNTVALDAGNVPLLANATLDVQTGRALLEASAYIGDLALALTNTGQAPRNGLIDHVRMRLAGTDPTNKIAEASWRASNARSLSTQLLPNGTLHITGDYQVPQTLNVLYKDATRNVVLNASAAAGKFAYWILEDASAGGVRFKQVATGTMGTVDIHGALPKGSFEAHLVGTPARYTVFGALANETVGFLASGPISSMDVRYGLGAIAPLASGAVNAVAFKRLGTDAGGFHVQASDVQRLVAHHETGRVSQDSLFAISAPLALRFQDDAEEVLLVVQQPPTQSTMTHARGAFQWAAPSSSSLAYMVAAAGPHYLALELDSASNNVAGSWTTPYGDAFTGTITHGGLLLPGLALQDSVTTSDSSNAARGGWKLNAQDLPARLSIHAAPQDDVLDLAATTATGEPASAGHVDSSYSYNAPTLPVLPTGFQGAALEQKTQDVPATSAVVSFDAFKSLNLRLAGQGLNATAPSHVNLQRSAPGNVAFKATSDRTMTAVGIQITDAAPSLDLTVKGGGASYDAHIAWIASAVSGPASMRLESPGQDIALQTRDLTPSSFTLDWTPQTPFEVQTNAAFSLVVQLAESLTNAPYIANDFAAITLGSGTDAPPRVGVQLTGSTGFKLDAQNRILASTDDGRLVPFQADYREPNLGFQVLTNDLPSSLLLTWDPVARDFDFMTSQALEAIQVSHYPASDKSPRMFFAVEGSAAGITTFNQDLDDGLFSLSRPAAPGRIRISLDNGGVGLLKVLSEEGLFLDLADGAKVFLVDLHGVQAASGSLTAQDSPTFTASGDPGPGARLRMNNGGQRIAATVSARNPGMMSVTWPDPDDALHMRFEASGVAGRGVWLSETLGADSVQSAQTKSPNEWSLTSVDGRTLEYLGSAATTGVLTANGYWHDAAFKATIAQPGQSVQVLPSGSFTAGSVQTSGGVPSRVTVSLAAPGASTGPVAANVVGGDALSVDSMEETGMLYVSLPKPALVSWDMARPVEGRSAVAVDVGLAQGTSSGMVLQFVDAQQQTMYRLPKGAIASTHLNLGTTADDWKLHVDSGGKSVQAQQQALMGSLSVVAGLPASLLDVTARPSATTPFETVGSQVTGLLLAETQWAGGSLKAHLEQMPTAFKATTSGAIPSTGLISTLGSGSANLADLLVIPAGATANRYASSDDHVAVAATGNTPYAALRAHGFQQASWSIPEATNTVLEGKLVRSSPVGGLTALILEGPVQDLTARIQSAAATVGIASRQHNVEPGASTSQPLTMTYTSTGGSSQRFDVTHVDSGHVVSSHIAGASGVTTIEATGAEPARINVIGQTVQSGLGIKTTDLGTGLNLQVKNPVPPRLVAEVQRGTCGATIPERVSVSTLGTGTAGPTLVQIGDQSRVPADRSSNYAILSCDGTAISVGARVPFVTELLFAEASCKGFQAKIPANTPMPIGHSDETGTYSIQLQSEGAVGGILDLIGDCEGLRYWFNATSGVPARIANLRFTYDRLGADPPPSDEMQCLSTDKRCIHRMQVIGSGLPSEARAIFHGPHGPDQSGLQLSGGSGNLLDVKLVVSAKPPPENPAKEENETVEISVRGTMPLQQLRFYRTTDDKTFVDGSTPNMIILREDAGNDALFVKLEKVSYLEMDLKNDPQNKSFRMGATYYGDSHRRLDFHSFDKNCSQRRAVISNLPGGLSFEVVQESEALSYVRSNQASETIRSVRFASQGGNSCENPDHDGEVVFAAMTTIPAGGWNLEWLTGWAAGILRAQAYGGRIGHLEVGRAAIGHEDRYMTVNLRSVNLRLEWDIDGDTRYEGAQFLYCDTDDAPSPGTFRARYGLFGFGLTALGPGLECDNFQLRWGFGQISMPCFACKAPIPLSFPWLRFTGELLFLPTLKGEVLYADQWWNVPWNWLEEDD